MPIRVVYVGFKAWAYATAFLLWLCLGVRHQFLGTPPPCGQPALVAGKHQSAWETITLALVLDRPAFVLKRELAWIPVLGWYMVKMRMVPIDRSRGSRALRRMLRAAKRAKDDGRTMVIFPEGTRVAVGKTGAYQSGIAALYRHLDLPVTPLALNSGLTWGRKAFVKRPGMISAKFLTPIPPGKPKAEFLAALEQVIEAETAQLVNEERARR